MSDRRTDGQITCDRKAVLCIIVHRTVKSQHIIKIEGTQRVYISAKGHTLLKTGLSAHRHTQTDRQTKVKTVYPSVSLRALGGHNAVTVWP